MIEKVEVFKGILHKHAKNEDILYLEDATLNLIIDIIGGIIM